MVVGSIIVKDIDKNQKTLLLVIGLILLIIYSIGSQSLQWDVDKSGKPLVNESYEERPTGYGIPGFELIPAITAIVFIYYLKRKRIG